MSGAHSPALTIAGVRPEDAGAYRLTIVDDYGRAESTAAALTVLPGDCLPPPSGLAGFWTADAEMQEALNRPTARMLQGVPTGEGVVGRAFVFSRTNDTVVTTLNTEASAMPETTWAAWIHPTKVFAAEDQFVFVAGGHPQWQLLSTRQVLIGRTTDTFQVTGPGGWPVAAAPADTNRWQHLAVTFTTNRVELYLGGERRFATNLPASQNEGNGRFAFGGAGAPWTSLQGRLDEVAVFDRVLSPEEIRVIYDVSRHGKCRPEETPSMAEEPPSALVHYEGEPMRIEALARGSAWLGFQWHHGEHGLLPGQTNEHFQMPTTELTDAGRYWLVATNVWGGTTSRVATVTIRPPCETPRKLADGLFQGGNELRPLFHDSRLNATFRLAGSGMLRWSGQRWVTEGAAPEEMAEGYDQIAYDPARGVAVRFAGGHVRGRSSTWEWDSALREWHLAASSGPSPRYGHAMAWWPDRGSVLLFGGGDATGRDLGDTWELAGSGWVPWPIPEPTVDGRPPGPPLMVFDPAIGGMLVAEQYKATWTLAPPATPEITRPPEALIRFVGEFAAFTGCASARDPLAYQWLRNGGPDGPASTNAVLRRRSVGPREAGEYAFVARSAGGAVTSQVARLTVLPCLPLPANAAAGWRAEGDGASLTGAGSATLLGGLGFAPGRAGRGFAYEGGPGHAAVPAATELHLSEARGWTAEGWIWAEDATPRPIVEWHYGGDGPAATGVQLWSGPPAGAPGENGTFHVNVRNSARDRDAEFTAGVPLLRTQGWQHVALVYDRPLGRATLYLDGVAVTNAPVGTMRTATDGDIVLGHRRGSEAFFKGVLDEFALYARALTAEEIRLIHRAGTAGKCDAEPGRPYIFVNDQRHHAERVVVPGAGPAEVALLPSLADGQIRYTLDGGDPRNGLLYDQPFLVTVSTLVRAVSLDGAGTPLAEAHQRIEFDPAGPGTLRLIAITAAGGGIRLRAQGEAGAVHILERSTNLVQWAGIAEVTAGSEGDMEYTDSTPRPTAAFYRLRRRSRRGVREVPTPGGKFKPPA